MLINLHWKMCRSIKFFRKYGILKLQHIIHSKEQLPGFLCNTAKVYVDYGKNMFPKTCKSVCRLWEEHITESIYKFQDYEDNQCSKS